MIERAFEVASQDGNNKTNPIKQFALTQAWKLLEAAGVKDPAIKDQAVDTKPQTAAEESLYFIPEGVGMRFTRDIGGKSVKQLEAEAQNVRTVSEYSLDMIHSPKFTTLEEVTSQELIKLRVQDLGLTGAPATREVFERAMHSRIGNMALELCRAEVGPHQAIADTKQPLNDMYFIAHEPISGRYGGPRVFLLVCNAGGLWLGGTWAGPDDRWGPEYRLVFALHNIEPEGFSRSFWQL